MEKQVFPECCPVNPHFPRRDPPTPLFIDSLDSHHSHQEQKLQQVSAEFSRMEYQRLGYSVHFQAGGDMQGSGREAGHRQQELF